VRRHTARVGGIDVLTASLRSCAHIPRTKGCGAVLVQLDNLGAFLGCGHVEREQRTRSLMIRGVFASGEKSVLAASRWGHLFSCLKFCQSMTGTLSELTIC
jgi:hypothetical protein